MTATSNSQPLARTRGGDGRWPGGLLSGQAAWGVLVVASVLALAYGSIHPSPPSRSTRISYLESVIKCPSCEDLSIGQSEVLPAKQLRAQVVRWVDAGWSNQRIEQAISDRFGPSELLRPTSVVPWLVPIIAIAIAAGGLATALWRRRWRTAPGLTRDTDEALVAGALQLHDRKPGATD